MFYKKFLSIIITTLMIVLLVISPLNVLASTNSEQPVPSSYNSKNYGYCSSVKNQGSSGICWAYATLASYESLLLRNNLYTTDYDPVKIDKWATPDANGNGWNRAEGTGEYSTLPMGYLASWEGPTTNNNQKSNIGVTGIEYLGTIATPPDKYHIKELIMKSGAVTASMNANPNATNDYIHYCAGYGLSIDSHEISVVGWDDNYSKSNFINNPTNDGAWLCKNSWGNYNSLGGYFWISYSDKFLFRMRDEAFGITSYQKIDSNTHIYQNEKYGATMDFDYINQDQVTFINVFDFSKYGNKLDKVVFETTAEYADYTVWYIPLNNNTPVASQSQWEKLGSGRADYRGYICVDVDDILLPKKKVGIAVSVDAACASGNARIGVTEAISTSEPNVYSFKDPSNYGESFIYYNNTMQDLKSYYKTERNDNVGCHFVIKAITIGMYDPNVKGDYDLNGKLNINDVTTIQLHVARIHSLTNNQKHNAGHSDSRITVNDATTLQLALAKLINLT